jgi:hypothetical protein
MKITIDHNCLVDIENVTGQGQATLKLARSADHECFIVNIGASELRQKGIRPDTYDLFDFFIRGLGLAHLRRLDPMMLIDVGFFDHGIMASDEMVQLSESIGKILFPQPLNSDVVIESSPYGALGRKQLNHSCDIHTMWCHIYYGNHVFLTSDRNFHKSSKRSQLQKLGADLIMTPTEMLSWSGEKSKEGPHINSSGG